MPFADEKSQARADAIAFRYRDRGREMSAIEKRIRDRDAKYHTGSARFLEEAASRHSRNLFPHGTDLT